jgi:hypothetical protein
MPRVASASSSTRETAPLAMGKRSCRLHRVGLSSLVLSGSAGPGPRHARLTPKAAVGDTHRAMPEESTTPDLVELVRQMVEAGNRRDFDAAISYFAPDAVLDTSRTLFVEFHDRGAIRKIVEEWIGGYDEFDAEPETLIDLGNGIIFSVHHQTGRPPGSTGRVEQREAWVYLWVDGLIARITVYPYLDIDEARAAAERLAEERG